MEYPDFEQPFYTDHIRRLCYCYQHWTGSPLLPDLKAEDDPVRAVFDAPFVLVSHGTEAIPVFNFGNRKALELFEMEWDAFIKLPSSQSADEDNQAERAALMARVAQDGYALNCSGSRVTASGKRFNIEGATVWNVIDEQGRYYGQAAMFENWSYI